MKRKQRRGIRHGSKCSSGSLYRIGVDNIAGVARREITKHGLAVIAVPDPDGRAPTFLYTIGNHERGLPELIWVGTGDPKAFCGVLNHASEIQRERASAFAHGELVSLGGRLPVKIVDATVRAKADYTFQVGHYYDTEDYQVRQLLAPDRDGRYPGDPLCAEPSASRPVLSPN